MITASLLSIVFSGGLLALLGVRDPKRLRNSGHGVRRRALPSHLRRASAWLVLAPGLILAAIGQWWAFFIWFGAITALGWLTATLLATDH